MRIGDCGQCESRSVKIAKSLPSSGLWCIKCNTERLKTAKIKTSVPRPLRTSSHLQALVKQLDKIFSIYTRTRDANEHGFTACVTCGIESHWVDMDCGHCFSRGNFAIRWDERNVHAQCRPCNRMEDGCFEDFEAHVKRAHGLSAHAELLSLKNSVRKLERQDLESMIDKYRNLNQQNISI